MLLQVTVGCSHNKCSYCAMYREKRFRPKPWNVIEKDILEAASIGPRFRKVFLCDGDALILPMGRLVEILTAFVNIFPGLSESACMGTLGACFESPFPN